MMGVRPRFDFNSVHQSSSSPYPPRATKPRRKDQHFSPPRAYSLTIMNHSLIFPLRTRESSAFPKTLSVRLMARTLRISQGSSSSHHLLPSWGRSEGQVPMTISLRALSNRPLWSLVSTEWYRSTQSRFLVASSICSKAYQTSSSLPPRAASTPPIRPLRSSTNASDHRASPGALLEESYQLLTTSRKC